MTLVCPAVVVVLGVGLCFMSKGLREARVYVDLGGRLRMEGCKDHGEHHPNSGAGTRMTG